VNKIFQVTLCKVGQSLIPTPEYQDMEPLDKEADKGEDPVNPEDNPDDYPVGNTDKQLKTAGVSFKGKKLFRCTRYFVISYQFSVSSWLAIKVLCGISCLWSVHRPKHIPKIPYTIF
jgi:hypothetical protein